MANYSQTCPNCNKSFNSPNAYTNHLSSRRHRATTSRTPWNRLDSQKGDDDVSSMVGSTIDLSGSVASVDDLQNIETGMKQLNVVPEVYLH